MSRSGGSWFSSVAVGVEQQGILVAVGLGEVLEDLARPPRSPRHNPASRALCRRRMSASCRVASVTDGDRPRTIRSPRRSRMNVSSWVVLASEIAIRFWRTDLSSDRAEMSSVSAVSTPQGISEMHRKKNSRWVLILVRGQRALQEAGPGHDGSHLTSSS